jgi:hypothetical protein
MTGTLAMSVCSRVPHIADAQGEPPLWRYADSAHTLFNCFMTGIASFFEVPDRVIYVAVLAILEGVI